jgi:hypothetical protein
MAGTVTVVENVISFDSRSGPQNCNGLRYIISYVFKDKMFNSWIMKKFLIGMCLLAVLFSPSMVVFAGVAGPVDTPAWVNCIGQTEWVQSTSKAYAGTSNVLVAWVAPYYDAWGSGGLCIQKSFSLMQFTVQVYHAGLITANGPTFSSSTAYPPNGITVSVIHTTTTCVTHVGCWTTNTPYILKVGDGICVNELVWYGAYIDHSGGYCYYV